MRNALFARLAGLNDGPLHMFAEIGMILCNLQSVEELLRVVAMATRNIDTGEEISDILNLLKRGALGRLIREIKAHTTVDDDFEDDLRELLKLRNEFVHHAFVRGKYQFLENRDFERETTIYLSQVSRLTSKVHNVLNSYVMASAYQHDSDFEVEEAAKGLAIQGITFEEAKNRVERLCHPNTDPLNIAEPLNLEVSKDTQE